MVESTLSQPHDTQEAGTSGGPPLQAVDRPDDPTESLANAYIDFDAGHVEQPVAAEDVAKPRQLAEELSVGPNMTGVRPKLGFLQEVRKNRTMVSDIKSSSEILLFRLIDLLYDVKLNGLRTQRSEPEAVPSSLVQGYPLTTSTQQADVDSQSLVWVSCYVFILCIESHAFARNTPLCLRRTWSSYRPSRKLTLVFRAWSSPYQQRTSRIYNCKQKTKTWQLPSKQRTTEPMTALTCIRRRWPNVHYWRKNSTL